MCIVCLEFQILAKECDACRCMSALPDDYSSLVPKLLAETMLEIGASFASRVNLATGDVVPETRTLTKGTSYETYFYLSNSAQTSTLIILSPLKFIIPFRQCLFYIRYR